MEHEAQRKHDELVALLQQIAETCQRIAESMVTAEDLYEPLEPDCYD
jgi:hypothetical protein